MTEYEHTERVRAAVEAEREACAEMMEHSRIMGSPEVVAQLNGAAIRARGETPSASEEN